MAGPVYINVIRCEDVMKEQFAFLMEHYRRSRRNPKLCGLGRGGSCPSCSRFLWLMNVLTAPFKMTRSRERKALAA